MTAELKSNWRHTWRSSSVLLLIWLLVNLLLMTAALRWPLLLELEFAGYPLPFFIFAQALPLFYLLLCELSRRVLGQAQRQAEAQEHTP